jgi:hypothetical protein
VFLPLFAIALHKSMAYPPGHPLLLSAVDVVTVHLRMVLLNRPFLLLGVARNQLLVEALPPTPTIRSSAISPPSCTATRSGR